MNRAFQTIGLAGATALFVMLIGCPVATAGPFTGKNGPIAVVKSRGNTDYLGVYSKKRKFRTLYKSVYSDPYDSDQLTDLSFSPSGTRIAFSHGWRPSRLSIANVRTGKGRYVPTGRIDAYLPSWGSNGRITFLGSTTMSNKRRGTYSVREGGGGRHRLFKAQTLAASVDQHWFVTAGGDQAASHHLDLLNDKGNRVRSIVRDRRYQFSNPAFSANGRWIAYQRNKSDTGGQAGSLFVVRRDGTHRRRLTTGNRDGAPAFSPDGRWIVFIRQHRGGSLNSNVAVLANEDDPSSVR